MNDLKLDTPEGESANLYSGNNDLATLLVNYIKCNAMGCGVGSGTDFFKNDDLNKKLFAYLARVSKDMHTEFFAERSEAELKFDKALKSIA